MAKDFDKLQKQINELRKDLGALSFLTEDMISHVAHESNAGRMRAGEQVLRKAAELNISPSRLRERAEAALNANEYGSFEELLQRNDIAQARRLVERAERLQRDTMAKADEQSANGEQIGITEKRLDEAEAVIRALQRQLGKLEARFRRPKAPRATKTVAKAQPAAERHSAYRDTPQGLLTRADALFDNPNQIGALSEMISSGNPQKVQQARETIERAEFERDAKAGRL